MNRSAWRANVVARAFTLVNHVWSPSNANVYHGLDSDGVQVNTPDTDYSQSRFRCGWWAPNQPNAGIPYMWGGYSSIEEFDAGVAAGLYAGNVPEDRTAARSRHCEGFDCSGLISRCWDVGNTSDTFSQTISSST